MAAETRPGSTTPVPTAPAAWSPAPPTTGMPGSESDFFGGLSGEMAGDFLGFGEAGEEGWINGEF